METGVDTIFPYGNNARMNLVEKIQACLDARGWKATKLANEAGVPIPCITRVLSGERQGMHSKNLMKLQPFFCDEHGNPKDAA